MASPEKIEKLKFTTLEFYGNYVISKIKEGVIFDKKHLGDLIKICATYYAPKSFIYISRRIHNYNVNPLIYHNLKRVENLAGIAVVSDNSSTIINANFEKNFCNVPFNIFIDIEDAVSWGNELLEN